MPRLKAVSVTLVCRTMSFAFSSLMLVRYSLGLTPVTFLNYWLKPASDISSSLEICLMLMDCM